MKKLLLFSLFFLTSTLSFAYKEHYMLSKNMTAEKLKSMIVMNQEWVDYPAYQDRVGWANFMGEFRDDYIKFGEKYLHYEWQYIKASDYLIFDKTGDRKTMEVKFKANNNALGYLFLAEMAEGKGRFIDQLVDGVFMYCEMTTWELSACLIHHQKISLPDMYSPFLDLGAGHVGATLAWIYHYLSDEFEKIAPALNRRICYELKEKIMDTYIENENIWWMAKGRGEKGQVNNWNPWCNSNSLLVFGLMENDPDKLTEAVLRTLQSVDKFINYTKEDGACEEGPAYWSHAGGKLFDYLNILYKITGGKVSVFDHPMIRRIGEYIANSYVGDKWVVNFGDAAAKGGGDAKHIFNYGYHVGSDLMMGYAKMIYKNSRFSTLFFDPDIMRVFESFAINDKFASYNKPFEPLSYVWYSQTEFCYMTNKNGLFFAGKGGHNNESHNHNDTGSCNLYLDAVPILIDAGVVSYTRETFSKDRYKIWSMQSDYHNIPKINGVSQKEGYNFNAKDASFDSKQMKFTLDIAPSYPKEARVKSWIREYQLKSKELIITDKFAIDGAEKANQINFMSWGDIDISTKGVVSIKVNDKEVEFCYNPKDFKVELEKIELNDPNLSGNWGKNIYRISLNSRKCVDSDQYTFTVKIVQ